MTTGYSLSDTLPKDSAAQKLLAGIDINTSQLDFALLAAIGAQTASSKIYGHLLTGGGMVASVIKNQAVGMPLLLGYQAAPSNLAAGGFQLARGNEKGYQFTTQASMVACTMAGSTETASAASGVVYGALIGAGSAGTVAGGCVVLLDGATSRGFSIFSAVNDQNNLNFGPRGIGFGTNIRYERRNTTADVIVTLMIANDVRD